MQQSSSFSCCHFSVWATSKLWKLSRLFTKAGLCLGRGRQRIHPTITSPKTQLKTSPDPLPPLGANRHCTVALLQVWRREQDLIVCAVSVRIFQTWPGVIFTYFDTGSTAAVRLCSTLSKLPRDGNYSSLMWSISFWNRKSGERTTQWGIILNCKPIVKTLKAFWFERGVGVIIGWALLPPSF